MSDIRDKARRGNRVASIAAIQLAKQMQTSRIHKWRSPQRAPRLSFAALPYLVSAGRLRSLVWEPPGDCWSLL